MNFGILMTTGVSFEGYRITSYCGVISKEVVFRNGVGRSLDAAITNFGDRLTFKDTELSGSTALIENAKSYLRAKFEDEVRKKGANAVLGIDFESSFGTDFVRAAMSGTAVIVEEDPSQAATYNAETETEDEIKPRIGVLRSNVISPFFPLKLLYSQMSKGIMAALCVQPDDGGKVGDIKADVIFMDRFKDTYKAENCCFLDFTKASGKTYISSLTQIDVPSHMCRCLESCNIIIKKYFYNAELVEERDLNLKEIPVIQDIISISNRASLLAELQMKENANEMLKYVESIQDILPEKTYSLVIKTLKTRWDMERMYGTNKKSTISVLERILSPEE